MSYSFAIAHLPSTADQWTHWFSHRTWARRPFQEQYYQHSRHPYRRVCKRRTNSKELINNLVLSNCTMVTCDVMCGHWWFNVVRCCSMAYIKCRTTTTTIHWNNTHHLDCIRVYLNVESYLRRAFVTVIMITITITENKSLFPIYKGYI